MAHTALDTPDRIRHDHVVIDYLRRIGALRAILLASSLAVVVLAPFAGGYPQTSGFPLLTTLLAPVFYVIVIFLLPLDMMMTGIFMSGKPQAERERYKLILKSEAVALLALVLSWGPFVARLLRLI